MDSTDTRPLMKHPMAKWAGFVIILFILWFAGWFVFASYADGWVEKAIKRVDQRGIRIECNNRSIKGFPFRIGVNCDDLNISHKRDVYRFETGKLRTAAQLYAPGKIVAEIDGPFRGWPAGQEITAKWSSFRLFADANLGGGFDLASITTRDLSAQSAPANIDLKQGALHFRPTPEEANTGSTVKSLDAALSASDVVVSSQDSSLPSFNLAADMTLDEGYEDLIIRRIPLRSILRDGAQLNIRNLALITKDGGRIALSGPVEIHEDGLISGQLKIGLANADQVVAWFRQVDPNLAGPVKLLSQSIRGGKDGDIGGVVLKTVTVSINRGRPRLGFLPIPVEIPPLRFN